MKNKEILYYKIKKKLKKLKGLLKKQEWNESLIALERESDGYKNGNENGSGTGTRTVQEREWEQEG